MIHFNSVGLVHQKPMDQFSLNGLIMNGLGPCKEKLCTVKYFDKYFADSLPGTRQVKLNLKSPYEKIKKSPVLFYNICKTKIIKYM